MLECPKCKSKSVIRERKPDGITQCRDCGFTTLNTTLDFEMSKSDFDKEMIGKFKTVLEKLSGSIPESELKNEFLFSAGYIIGLLARKV